MSLRKSSIAGLKESYRLRASCRHDRDDGRKEDREDSLAGLVNNHDEQEVGITVKAQKFDQILEFL